MRLFIFLSTALLIFQSCFREKLEIANFNQELSSIALGNNLKSGIVQTQTDRGYLIGGQNANGDIIIIKTDEAGTLINQNTSLGNGALHDIVADTLANELAYLAIGEKGNGSFIVELEESGRQKTVLYDEFFALFNERIGLIEYVKAYALLRTQDGNFVITGAMKQTLGTERLFLLKLDQQFSSQPIWLKTYSNDAIGINLSEDEAGHILVAGYNQNNVAAFKTSSTGTLLWKKTLFDVPLRDSALAPLIAPASPDRYLLSAWMSAENGPELYQLDAQNGSILQSPQNPGYNISSHYFIPTRDSGWLVAGIALTNRQINNFILLKAGGDVQFPVDLSYELPGIRACNKIIQTSDHGFMFLFVTNDSLNRFTFRLLKTDEIGAIEVLE